jgi:hypothetical protein
MLDNRRSGRQPSFLAGTAAYSTMLHSLSLIQPVAEIGQDRPIRTKLKLFHRNSLDLDWSVRFQRFAK